MSIDHPVAKVPTRERGKQRVAALLDAAAILFAEKGYGPTTMTEIAARAGAAIGSLYQFFPSKEALAEALFERYAERASAGFARFVAAAPGLPPAKLADLLVDRILDIRSDREAAVAMSDAIVDIVERRKPLRNAMRRQLAALLLTLNPTLTEVAAIDAATMISLIMKTVPALIAEGTGDGQPPAAQARIVLALYIDHIFRT